MKILILSDFLGSGKTTVLMQLARYLVSHSDSESFPVVILENEISENGVDNQLLSRNNFTVENLFSGCACCTSSGQLCRSIRYLKEEYDPQWLIIEATGIAYPDNIQETIQDNLHMPSSVLALVDVKRWHKVVRAMEQFIVAQLGGAAVILLTKIDLADSETVEAVKNAVRNYSGEAALYPICAIEPQGDDFWKEIVSHLDKEG